MITTHYIENEQAFIDIVGQGEHMVSYWDYADTPDTPLMVNEYESLRDYMEENGIAIPEDSEEMTSEAATEHWFEIYRY